MASIACPRVHSCSTLICPLSNLSWLSDTNRTISVLQGSKKRRVQARRADTSPASDSRLESCSSWKHRVLMVSFSSTVGSLRELPTCSRSATRWSAAAAMVSDMIPTERSSAKTCREEEQLPRRCWKACSSAVVGPCSWLRRNWGPESLWSPTELLVTKAGSLMMVVRLLVMQYCWSFLQPCLRMHPPAEVHRQATHGGLPTSLVLRSLVGQTGPTGGQRCIPNCPSSGNLWISFRAMTLRQDSSDPAETKRTKNFKKF